MAIDRRHLLALALIALAAPARGHSYRLGAISIGHAWMLPGRTTSEAFVPLALAAGAEPDQLLSAETALARAIGFRRGGEPLELIDLAPGRGVAMRPGALHLAVSGLVRPLVLGEHVPVRLRFRRAGAIEVAFWVEERPYGGGPPRAR